MGDERPKRGARVAAEKRLAELLPDEAGPTAAPPPGLPDPDEDGASETGALETLVPVGAPEVPVKREPDEVAPAPDDPVAAPEVIVKREPGTCS